MIWFTSDWHCGHRNVLRYEERPFSDLAAMHQTLISNWNAVVKPEDTGIFAGDMSFLNTSDTYAIINQLNGTKIIVLGNHDGKPKAMVNCGFALAVFQLRMQICGEPVIVSHYPYRPSVWQRMFSSKARDLRYMERRPPNKGEWLIHGHTHGRIKTRDKQLHVGVDAHEFKPVPITWIESIIARATKSANK